MLSAGRGLLPLSKQVHFRLQAYRQQGIKFVSLGLLHRDIQWVLFYPARRLTIVSSSNLEMSVDPDFITENKLDQLWTSGQLWSFFASLSSSQLLTYASLPEAKTTLLSLYSWKPVIALFYYFSSVISFGVTKFTQFACAMWQPQRLGSECQYGIH